MRPFSASENVVSSMKTTPTVPSAPVSSTSPWKIGSPALRVSRVPSVRTTSTVPSTDSTRPMGSVPSVAVVWAYWPGARGPASLTARSARTMAPPGVIRSGGVCRRK